ncbi:MAG: glycoside hydrolase family 3 N-terminal domain-containing protein [Sphingopyxis sp.]
MTPAIVSLAGPALSADEAALFRGADPAGYILFARNIVDPDQLRRLTDALRGLHGRDDLAILIDQEGGKVARLSPPHWPDFPAGSAFGRLYDVAPASALAAVEANALAIALTLHSLGITVNAWPLLDVRTPLSYAMIADRSFGGEPMRVAALGRAAIKGLRAGGVVGVVKHMPGKGRAVVDSHVDLPRVMASADELESDLAPFRALRDAPMGMTAHIVYEAWDAARPATQSPIVINDIIRGRIGFDGLLMSDAIEMEALSGSIAARALAALVAGCDVALHCTGVLAETAAMIEAIGGDMDLRSRERLDRAMQMRNAAPDVGQLADALARRDALLGLTEIA